MNLAQAPGPDVLRRWLDAVSDVGAPGLGPLDPGKPLLSVAFLLGIWAVRILIVRAAERRVRDERTRYRIRKGTARGGFVLAVALLGVIWLEWVPSLGTFLGLIIAGLAIALREPVMNVAGWVFLVLRKPLNVGDRIEINAHAGDVVDIRVFHFSLLEIGGRGRAEQSTGRIIHVPTGQVLTHPVANYTADFDFIWDEIQVTITFESDWRRAKEILAAVLGEVCGGFETEARRAIEAASRKNFILYRTLTPTVYTSVGENGVLFSLRYPCPPRKRRWMAERIWERVLDEFAGEPVVAIAYPTRRVFQRSLAGSPGPPRAVDGVD
jgi:small-conductance mechanosensitive channel